MAVNGQDQDIERSGDILSRLEGVENRTTAQNRFLSSIDSNLSQIMQEFSRMSSANAINSYGDGRGGFSYNRSAVYNRRVSQQRSHAQNDGVEDAIDEITSGITSRIATSILNSRGLNNIVSSVLYDLKRPIHEKIESSVYDLLDGIEHSLKRGAGSADVSKRIKSSLESLASDLGVETKDIGKGIGKLLGQKLLQNADVKAVADFGKQFAQTQIQNIRAAYQSGKAGQIQDMPDLIRRQTLRESLSDLPEESEKEEILRRTGKSGIGLTNAREELLRQNAEKARTKYIGDPSDLSETEASTRRKPDDDTDRSDNDKDRSDNVQAQIRSANELTINAQSCVINTDNLDINIEGSGLDELFNRMNEPEQSTQDVSTNQEFPEIEAPEIELSDIEVPEIELPDIELPDIELPEIEVPEITMPEIEVPEITVPDVVIPETEIPMPEIPEMSEISIPDLQEISLTSREIADNRSEEINSLLSESDKKSLAGESDNPEYKAFISEFERRRIDMPYILEHSALDAQRQALIPRDIDSTIKPEDSALTARDEMPSLMMRDDQRLLHTTALGNKQDESPQDLFELSEINETPNVRRQDMGSISNEEITATIDNPALSGLENVAEYLHGGLDEFMHSNIFTGRAFDVAESTGSSLFGGIKDFASSAFGAGKERYLSEIDLVQKGAMSATDMSGLGGMISTLTGGATEAGAALSGATSAIAALGPAAIAAAAAIVVVGGALKKSLEPAIEGIKKVMNEASTSMHRTMESAKKNVENSQKRIMDDVRTLVETPFNILKEAAQDWYNAWDSNIRTINATQGYTKADLQDLMASFAERLRTEGLTSVVAATDITNNLTKVLQSGLSGQIAEEFAYLATKLNAAVPTQDFFSYADTYASIAANAVRAGATQSAAIEEASQQLIAFANNVLYASREVAGGFTTGLQNAESLFKQSVQISQAAKSYNASEISGVMTSVSAIVGAIAPDVASSLTDAIYKAAVGGNSNEIVALRSLAGINASNTEFLQQIATDAKTVFSDLFEELGKRQNMSESGYMEVAEGLSSIFGLSMDAFARVDFNYLAQAIESMDTSSAALSDNIMLLASGETTTNAEQLKMQEINKLILDEGLSYVLDNEAARSIQEHMWDEQLARQLQETEYGVNLHGAALEALEGIKATVNLILDILNPIRLIGRIADLFKTSEEFDALRSDVATVLELGKVGSGNAQQMYNLTHTNEDLNVTDNLVSLLGGSSRYAEVHSTMNNGVNGLNFLSAAYNPVAAFAGSAFSYDVTGNLGTGASEQASEQAFEGGTSSGGFGGGGGRWGDAVNGSGSLNSPTSGYNWSSVSKSEANTLSSSSNVESSLPERAWKDSTDTSSNADDFTSKSLQSMLDSMSDYVSANRSASYEDWTKTASTYGIENYEKALEQYGLTYSQVEAGFNMLQAQISAQEKLDREEKEESFWKDTTEKTSEIYTECKLRNEDISSITKNIELISGNIDTYTASIYSSVSDTRGFAETINDSTHNIESMIIKEDSLKSMLSSTVTSPIEAKFDTVIQGETSSVGLLTSLSQRLDSIENILINGSIDVHDSSLLQELINLHVNLVVDGDSTQNQIIRQLETLITMLQSSGGSTLARLPFSLFALSGAANN